MFRHTRIKYEREDFPREPATMMENSVEEMKEEECTPKSNPEGEGLFSTSI